MNISSKKFEKAPQFCTYSFNLQNKYTLQGTTEISVS